MKEHVKKEFRKLAALAPEPATWCEKLPVHVSHFLEEHPQLFVDVFGSGTARVVVGAFAEVNVPVCRSVIRRVVGHVVGNEVVSVPTSVDVSVA